MWSETIGAHRREVRDAIMDTTAALAAERGPLSVTMSQIAEAAGIARATLYKYFPDVEAILLAWHERHVDGHLERLVEIAGSPADVRQRLEQALEVYALMCRRQPRAELVAVLHRGAHVEPAQHRLASLVQQLLSEAVRAGAVRDDVPVTELAAYCLHALTAAGRMPSRSAARRLVNLTLAGLRP